MLFTVNERVIILHSRNPLNSVRAYLDTIQMTLILTLTNLFSKINLHHFWRMAHIALWDKIFFGEQFSFSLRSRPSGFHLVFCHSTRNFLSKHFNKWQHSSVILPKVMINWQVRRRSISVILSKVQRIETKENIMVRLFFLNPQRGP